MDTQKIIDDARSMLRKVAEPLGIRSEAEDNNKDNSQETKELSLNDTEKGQDKSGNVVILYGLSTCPWCKKARNFFMEKDVTLDYIEYDKADEDTRKSIEEECSSHMEKLAFPVAIYGDDVVVGYDPKKYADIIKR